MMLISSLTHSGQRRPTMCHFLHRLHHRAHPRGQCMTTRHRPSQPQGVCDSDACLSINSLSVCIRPSADDGAIPFHRAPVLKGNKKSLTIGGPMNFVHETHADMSNGELVITQVGSMAPSSTYTPTHSLTRAQSQQQHDEKAAVEKSSAAAAPPKPKPPQRPPLSKAAIQTDPAE